MWMIFFNGGGGDGLQMLAPLETHFRILESENLKNVSQHVQSMKGIVSWSCHFVLV